MRTMAAVLAMLLSAISGSTALAASPASEPIVSLPEASSVRSEIFLISDEDGWTEELAALAGNLRSEGAIVVGIDIRSYLAAIERSNANCLYLVSGIERYSHQIQRKLGNSRYQSPIVAGVGTGGTLALAIAAQTPPATVAKTIAIDPGEKLPFDKPLCTPAHRELTPSGIIYDLTEGALPNPIEAVFSTQARDIGRAHIQKLLGNWPEIDVHDTQDDRFDAALAALSPSDAESSDGLAGLPLTILDTKPTRNVMAVVYSGDGGWRDLDKIIAERMKQSGVPVVGVDALRYFWSERTPKETAADLDNIIATYTTEWNVSGVYLVGYSFGADILPSTYLELDGTSKKTVKKISLLGISHTADYQISVAGWLGESAGTRQTLPDILKIASPLIQCVYGQQESDTVCPELETRGIEVIATKGGHHFDGNYQALADKILESP